jgi:hypothetical protein
LSRRVQSDVQQVRGDGVERPTRRTVSGDQLRRFDPARAVAPDRRKGIAAGPPSPRGSVYGPTVTDGVRLRLEPGSQFVGECCGRVVVDQMSCVGDDVQTRPVDGSYEACRAVYWDPGVLLTPDDVDGHIDVG